MSITDNLIRINENIKTALLRRKTKIQAANDVTIVAVTKNQDVTKMKTVIDAGITVIGENRVQEALSKQDELAREVSWHLIGHLQTNKVRQAVPLFDIIHSVDSENLASEIDRVAKKHNKRQKVLLQVNVAREETKYGIKLEQVRDMAQFIGKLEYVNLCGLMTIAPNLPEVEQTRPIFRELYYCFKELQDLKIPNTEMKWLSMGMTNDYHIAIEEGANLVRIGTGIFGQRQY